MVFFSVVVTVYNKENYILKTLQSVCKQNFKDFELLIINDGSTDNSLKEIAKIEFENKTVITTVNKGVSAARNTGIEKANGKYLAFLDGDDLWSPLHLEKIKEAIDSYPDATVFSNASCTLTNGRIKQHDYAVTSKIPRIYNYFKASTKASILHPSSVVIRKSLYEKIGGFNTSYSNYEDIEYWFRIGLNYEVVFTNDITVTIRSNKNSLSNQDFIPENYCFFEGYEKFQTNCREYYQVLNNNLLSLALLCKFNNETYRLKSLKKRIENKYLHRNSKTLLFLPTSVISVLINLKNVLSKLGIKIYLY